MQASFKLLCSFLVNEETTAVPALLSVYENQANYKRLTAGTCSPLLARALSLEFSAAFCLRSNVDEYPFVIYETLAVRFMPLLELQLLIL